jgi:hypothetical protein
MCTLQDKNIEKLDIGESHYANINFYINFHE